MLDHQEPHLINKCRHMVDSLIIQAVSMDPEWDIQDMDLVPVSTETVTQAINMVLEWAIQAMDLVDIQIVPVATGPILGHNKI